MYKANKFFRLLRPLVVLTLLAGVFLTACSDQNKTVVQTSKKQEIAKDMTMQQRAEQTYQAIQKAFYVPAENLYLENYESKADDKAFSYLWPYSGVISALNALAKLPGESGKKYQGELVQVLNGLEQYWDGNATVPGYDSYIRRAGGGQKFYDDNEWLGMDFVEAYHTLGEAKYLKKAQATFDFAVSGWSEEMGGGIYWRENDPDTKNTCSNGPGALLALYLYQETHEQKYLEWAKKILSWTKQLKSTDSGVYWDNLTKEGTIDKRTFTYNTGTILHSNALLYQITGDKAYLDEAKALAEASLEHFYTKDPVTNLSFYPDTPWFNSILFRGYVALYRVDPAHDPKFVEAIRQNIDYAWEHSRTGAGLFSPDWSGKSGLSNPHKWLLDQAPMVEFYATFAHFPS